jgi:hypothetical protein
VSRQAKTHRQRAQEDLALCERIVTRLAKQRDKLRADLKKVEADHEAAVARRDHAKTHPDLRPAPGTSTTRPSTGAADG